jgi:hypothetical protein
MRCSKYLCIILDSKYINIICYLQELEIICSDHDLWSTNMKLEKKLFQLLSMEAKFI